MPPDYGGPFDSPLGAGGTGEVNNTYLIRDLQLHQDSSVPHDVTSLTSTRSREYDQPDLMSVGAMSFTFLFDTDLGDIVNAGSEVYDHPLLRQGA